jgi:SPP1 family predicted phage head-tail adaptor
MQAGRLDRRIRIERNTATRNSRGEVIAAWTVVAETWAQKNDLAGREPYRSEQFESQSTTRWRMRYRTDLDPTMRIVHIQDGQVYEIDAVSEIGRREGLDVFTTVKRPARAVA